MNTVEGMNEIEESGLRLTKVNLEFQCVKCGHVWGVRFDNLADLENLPKSRLVCMRCKYDEQSEVRNECKTRADASRA